MIARERLIHELKSDLEEELAGALADCRPELVAAVIDWARSLAARGELMLLVDELIVAGDPARWTAAIDFLEALVADPDELDYVEPESTPEPAAPLLLLVEPS